MVYIPSTVSSVVQAPSLTPQQREARAIQSATAREYLRDKVTLPDGKLISQKDYDSLAPDERVVADVQGLDALNAYLKQKGEAVRSAAEYSYQQQLSEYQKAADANKAAIEAANKANAESEAAYQARIYTLPSGEIVDKSWYNTLTNEQKDKLNTLGIDGFNSYLDQQRAIYEANQVKVASINQSLSNLAAFKNPDGTYRLVDAIRAGYIDDVRNAWSNSEAERLAVVDAQSSVADIALRNYAVDQLQSFSAPSGGYYISQALAAGVDDSVLRLAGFTDAEINANRPVPPLPPPTVTATGGFVAGPSNLPPPGAITAAEYQQIKDQYAQARREAFARITEYRAPDKPFSPGYIVSEAGRAFSDIFSAVNYLIGSPPLYATGPGGFYYPVMMGEAPDVGKKGTLSTLVRAGQFIAEVAPEVAPRPPGTKPFDPFAPPKPIIRPLPPEPSPIRPLPPEPSPIREPGTPAPEKPVTPRIPKPSPKIEPAPDEPYRPYEPAPEKPEPYEYPTEPYEPILDPMAPIPEEPMPTPQAPSPRPSVPSPITPTPEPLTITPAIPAPSPRTPIEPSPITPPVTEPIVSPAPGPLPVTPVQPSPTTIPGISPTPSPLETPKTIPFISPTPSPQPTVEPTVSPVTAPSPFIQPAVKPAISPLVTPEVVAVTTTQPMVKPFIQPQETPFTQPIVTPMTFPQTTTESFTQLTTGPVTEPAEQVSPATEFQTQFQQEQKQKQEEKRKTKEQTKEEKKQEDEKVLDNPPRGTITYKQGLFWKTLPPPYTSEVLITSKRPPMGIRKIGRTPSQTIQTIGGPAPKEIDVDLGVTDVFIRGGDTQNPTIEFRGGGLKTEVGLRVPGPTRGITVSNDYGPDWTKSNRRSIRRSPLELSRF